MERNLTLSVIVPTRNRAGLWRSGRLLDSLRAQTSPPDELVVALDHTQDDTLKIIRSSRIPFLARILEVLAPRPGPNPASGVPDNCLFHAAAGAILVHVDDDIALPPRFLELTRALFLGLPPIVIWPRIDFVDVPPGIHDCRTDIMARHHWPTLPGGLVEIPRALQLRWGAVYACRAEDIHAIGGHDLETCPYHNSDTRLGNRLAAAGFRNFFAFVHELAVQHLGPTWHQANAHDPQAIASSRGKLRSKTIANGGAAFWSSSWFNAAYKCLPL